jgi:hypothetical protein
MFMNTNLIPLNTGNEAQLLSQYFQQADKPADRDFSFGNLDCSAPKALSQIWRNDNIKMSQFIPLLKDVDFLATQR